MRIKDNKEVRSGSNETKSMRVFSTMLDYLRVLMWPAVIVTVVFLFRTDLQDLLKRIQKLDAPGVSATLGTDKPEGVVKNPNLPDVYFSLPDNVAGLNCSDRAESALRKSGFGDIHKGEVTYGYTDKFVGAVWCRSQNPILITIAGPNEGLSAKQAEVDKRFRGELP